MQLKFTRQIILCSRWTIFQSLTPNEQPVNEQWYKTRNHHRFIFNYQKLQVQNDVVCESKKLFQQTEKGVCSQE